MPRGVTIAISRKAAKEPMTGNTACSVSTGVRQGMTGAKTRLDSRRKAARRKGSSSARRQGEGLETSCESGPAAFAACASGSPGWRAVRSGSGLPSRQGSERKRTGSSGIADRKGSLRRDARLNHDDPSPFGEHTLGFRKKKDRKLDVMSRWKATGLETLAEAKGSRWASATNQAGAST